MRIAIHLDGIGKGSAPARIARLEARLLRAIRQRLAAEAARDEPRARPQPLKAR